MPYIDKDDRKIIDYQLNELISVLKTNFARDGEINYTISRIMNAFYNEPSYDVINRGIGVLEAVKLEFYRSIASPYEDIKKRQNGDVYGL